MFKASCSQIFEDESRLRSGLTRSEGFVEGKHLVWLQTHFHDLQGAKACFTLLWRESPITVKFQGNSDCTNPIMASIPNIMPICSGYATAREVGDQTGYTNHYSRLGELAQLDPMLAFDGELHTFWADVAGNRAWLGLDFSSQVADVQCIKIAFPAIRSLQPTTGELQGWNGNTWKAVNAPTNNVFNMDSVLLLPLQQLGGQGFQRRPAPPHSIWKLENIPAISAWKVFELEFYTDLACRGNPVVGEPISSAEDAVLADQFSGHRNPHKAFDKDEETFWMAHCVDGVCPSGGAWLGLDLNGIGRKVECIRIMQSGVRTQQVRSVGLSAWMGSSFEQLKEFNGLGSWMELALQMCIE